jgi:AraC family transcriptional regulator
MGSEAAQFRVQILSQSSCVSLTRFDHPPGARLNDSEEQAADQHQINIVERGWFRLGFGKLSWTLGQGSVFLSRPGDVYSYSHMPHLEPDACLSLRYIVTPDDLAESFERLALAVPITNRLAFLRLQLLSGSVTDDPESLDMLACDFLDATQTAQNDRVRKYRPQQLKWYADRVCAAREAMEVNPADRHSLAQLASSVAMSPFLFARIFRELVGVPPHKYLVRLRLKRGHLLLESGMSVTDVCYAVGFNNLSHFIRTFGAYFGVLPSTVRRVQ